MLLVLLMVTKHLVKEVELGCDRHDAKRCEESKCS
jgi:hypothetical protein